MIKINKLLKKHKNDWNQVLKEARSLDELGSFRDAIVIYETFLARSPGNSAIQEMLATTLLKAGEFNKSLIAFKKALKLGANSPQVLLHKGIVEARLRLQDEALSSFNEALLLKSDYPLAHNNLGKLLGDLGRQDEALQSYAAAIKLDPSYLDAHFNRGATLFGMGCLDEALNAFRAALSLNEKHGKSLWYESMTLHALGHMDDADLFGALENVITIDPLQIESFNELGNLYKNQNKPEQALANYGRALNIDPNYSGALTNQGAVLNVLCRFSEALTCFNRAIEIDDRLAEAYVNRTLALLGLFREEEALQSAEHAIQLNPGLSEAHSNRAMVLTRLSRFEEALSSLSIAIQLKPDLAEAFNNRSDVYFQCGEIDAALKEVEQAITLNPHFAAAYNNKGIILMEALRLEEALLALDRAVNLDPQMADAQFNRSLLALLTGDFDEGLKGYEWRWKSVLRKQYKELGRPLWLGEESLRGKKILIIREQGLGDYIQHARYFPKLAMMGAEVFVQVPESLVTLSGSLSGSLHWISPDDDHLPLTDYYCPLMSLPLAFNQLGETIPADIPYFKIPEDRQNFWNQRLGPKIKPRIGLVWSGSITHRNDRQRSIPLELFQDLLDCPFEFHALQKEIRASDSAWLDGALNLRPYKDDLGDFADTAALVSEMDLIISVDTSVAHLAGALGVPVWILITHRPDFRWMLDRDDSPWYPNARLFRQPSVGDWEGVLKQIKTALKVHF